jgi:hypothetical protein
MKTFIAKLIFNININQDIDSSQFDEQIRIIKADSVHEAYHKAKSIGLKEAEAFVNPKMQIIEWKFINVSDIYDMDSYEEGEQLYSQTIFENDCQNYIQFLLEKSKKFQEKNVIFA